MDLKKAGQEKEEVLEKIKENKASIKKVLKARDTYFANLEGALSETKIAHLDTSEVLEDLEDDIQKRLNEIEDERPVTETIAAEYRHLEKSAIQINYEKLKEERSRLADYSTEQRLKNVSIIGATLDTYLYRFKEEKLNVDHIFLDEAGYSNIIKSLTLFNQKVPVTFLGDHMQLPPVCEISKRDIQENEDFRPVVVWDQSAIYLEDVFEQKDLDTVADRYLNNARGLQIPGTLFQMA